MRHDLHRHPELGYEEVRTSERVRERLDAARIAYEGGLAGGTGVLGYLPATTDPATARTVVLRADMDALPILEENELPYRSEHDGRMHACGHDGHTTMLATAAKVLAGLPERPQNVLFLFQPAEEGGAGGKRMVEEGVLHGRILGLPAQAVYGLHGWPSVEVGNVTTRVGPAMAAATQFEIQIVGKGSHAAYPHLGVDTVMVAAAIVTALQTVASRTVNPLDSVVVTVGKIVAGVAHNVIPEEAHLHGTFRVLNDDTGVQVRQTIERIVTNTAQAHGATANIVWAPNSYPVTMNHPEATERMRAVARDALGEERVHEERYPSMAAEDFSFYGREIPACFFFLGLRPVGASSFPSLHAPTFDFNDDAIATGVETMVNLGLRG
ncbi:MAG: M20 metallopeptidase family protein [Fimbriimonas sp.]